MYTDKINPDHPEGRLLISHNGFYLKKNNLEVRTKDRMRKSYKAILEVLY